MRALVRDIDARHSYQQTRAQGERTELRVSFQQEDGKQQQNQAKSFTLKR